MAAPVATTKRTAKESKRDTRPPARAAAESQQAERTISPSSAPLAGFTGIRRVPAPVNEPIKGYAPGSSEKKALKERLKEMAKERVEIPLIIGGKEIRTGETAQSVMPHDHRHVLADWHKASPKHVTQAIESCRKARIEWSNWAWEDRAAVLLKAAELHGATHKAVMQFQIVTDKRIPKVRAGRSIVSFFYRRDMQAVSTAIGDHKTDTGSMKLSSPELTGLDLLRYVHAVGTIDSIATVLSDLGAKMKAQPLQ